MFSKTSQTVNKNCSNTCSAHVTYSAHGLNRGVSVVHIVIVRVSPGESSSCNFCT